jgi:hypothetical protein
LDSRLASAVPLPKRLIIFFTPNGTVRESFTPTGGETDFKLGEILEPLAAHRDDLLILDGIDMESSYHGPGDNAHWSGMGHLLTGTSLIDLGEGVMWGGGISVDQLVAESASAETKIRSLELCVEQSAPTIIGRMSYLGPQKPVPPDPDPHRVYQRLFESATPEVRRARRSVLDAVGEDLSDLRKELGAEDRLKIEAHLEAVRDVERRLDIHTWTGAECAMDEPPEGIASDFVAAGKLQTDLLVMALACDRTRVASLMWSRGVSTTSMTWLGITTPHHELSHAAPTDAEARASLTAINRWYAERFAALLAALKAVPEGHGTLLDRCAVLWCNELSEGDVHSRRGIPLVIAGRCGGYFKTGRFLKYGGAEGGAAHNDLLISLCNAMDVDVKTFGDPAFCSGPLPGLTG